MTLDAQAVPTRSSVPRRRARVLEITSYPPPRAGWGVRVEHVRRFLEAQGHEVVILNTGQSRAVPSPEYETVLNGLDYVKKVWRYAWKGFTAHVHVNGSSWQGLVLALVAEVLALTAGRRPVLTFHAGIEQVYFPCRKSGWLTPAFWLLFAIPRTIICNNDAVRQRIMEYGISGAKVVPIQAFSRQYLEFERVPLGDEVETFYRRFPKIAFCYSNIRPGFFVEVLIDGFARAAAEDPELGLFLCGTSGYRDPEVWSRMRASIASHGMADRICIVDDLDHDRFLTALERAYVCLRTPISDGVASSVLQALALRVPVVGAENGHRPAGVVTYRHDDPEALAKVLTETLRHRDAIAASLPAVDVPDTVSVEAAELVRHRAEA